MATATSTRRIPNWLSALAPVAVIAVLVAVFLVLDPIGKLRHTPPVESLAVERTTLKIDLIQLQVRNDGNDPVTIAQVLVNDAYRPFTATDTKLARLGKTTIDIPYPWEEGLPLRIAFLTDTGLRIEHEIEAASLTPEPDASTFAIYGLLGVYIGLIPIVVGLLWFPALRRASAKWLAFFLAFTIGLLAFLLIDTVSEGLDLAAATPSVLNGTALFGIGALAAVVALVALGDYMGSRGSSKTMSGLTLAYFIASGIGLHNLGEGLAVGAALAAGEAALGAFLVLGFMLHNTTEGLAIVAPLGREQTRPPLKHFLGLGVVAGLPTVFGAWAGGFAFTPLWATLAFGVAAGAIAEVIWAVSKGMPRSARLTSPVAAAGIVTGLAFMYATSLFTA
ncbi:MAG: zinc transporter, family [Actinomycetota bacterium]|jgi:zinc transporter ZupT|nr:zinc transporter, family [Actinomycetota bacterium]